jgi:hypothetical protein
MNKKSSTIIACVVLLVVLAVARSITFADCYEEYNMTSTDNNCSYSYSQMYCDTGSYCDVYSTFCQTATGYSMSQTVDCYPLEN